MDAPGTVFYLVPENKYATLIVRDPANRDRRCVNPNNPTKPFLRIGLDQQLKSPPYLARFGRHERNDVILNNRFRRNDQCYFDFNKETGELLLHDISENNDTQLYDIVYVTTEEGEKEEPGRPHISKTRRQCVVVLAPDLYPDPDRPRNREWIFKMRDAEFRLIPRRTQGQDEAVFTEERLAFARQPDPEQTVEGTMQRLITLGLQSLQSEALTTTYKSPSTITINPHNIRFKTPLEPAEDKVIRYKKLRPLGSGGQGEVHKVVDMYDGKHHACKIVAVKAEVPEWRIHSERDFRARVEMEVNLVQELKHAHIVRYTDTQGFKIGRSIEIFMPIYQGSLHDLIKRYRPKRSELERQTKRPEKGPQAVKDMTDRMLSQILDALDFVHTHDPQIIHRDIKPANILYQGDEFLLTDFGIAKVVDTSRTVIGTEWYMAPEVRERGEQTPKVDIYGLGATVLECLAELPNEEGRRAISDWQEWYQELQTHLNQHAPRYTSMLAYNADQRPTARDLLDLFFKQPTRETPQANVTWTSFGVSSLTNQANGTTMIYSAAPTPMDWTQTVVTAIFQGNAQPTQQNEITQPLQPNPVALPSLKAHPNRLVQPGVKRGGSVKSARSTGERQKKGHKRGGSSQNGRRISSQSAGVPKRRSRSKSINKAQQIRALGMV